MNEGERKRGEWEVEINGKRYLVAAGIIPLDQQRTTFTDQRDHIGGEKLAWHVAESVTPWFKSPRTSYDP